MRRAILFAIMLLPALGVCSEDALQEVHHPHRSRHHNYSITAPDTAAVPDYAEKTYAYIQSHHTPPPGFEGGRTFGNYGHTLPASTRDGEPIRYQEWDVRTHSPHQNRGAERIVTGSDGRAWYTADHYRSFTPLRAPSR